MSRPLPATPSSSQLSLETGSTTPHVRPLPSLPSQVSLASTPTIQAARPLPAPPVPELKVPDRPQLAHKSSQLSQLSRKASQSLVHKKSQGLAHKSSQSLSPHPSPSLRPIDPALVPTPPSQPASQQPSPSVSQQPSPSVSQQPSPQPSPHMPHQPPPNVSQPPSNTSYPPPSAPQSPSSPVSPSEKSHGGIVARLGKKKRQLSRDLLKFGQPEDEDAPPVPARPSAMSSPSLHSHGPTPGSVTTPSTYGLAMTNSGEPFQMIAQHHMHTQGPLACQSPAKSKHKAKPSTPGKPPRLNLGLFSSRARKDSAPALGSGRRPSTVAADVGRADEHGVLHNVPSTDASARTDHSLSARTDHSANSARSTDDHLDIERASDVGSVRKRGSSTPSGAQAIASLFGRSPSPAKPATKSAGMAKSASSPGISSPPTTDRTPLSAGNQPPTSWKPGQAPAPPPKPAKLKAQAQGILNTALGLGMSLGGRGSVGVLPSSPSIAAALEYMRHEERDPRGSISRRAVLDGSASDGCASSVSDLKSSESDVKAGGDKASVTSGDKSSVCVDKSSVAADKASMSDAGKSISSDADKSSMSDVGKSSFSDVGAETSSGPSSSVGSLLSSNTGTGTSASEEHYPFTGREPSTSFDADASDSSVDLDHGQPVFNPAFSFNAHARPQPRSPQDPDKRVSTASSQRTLTAWNQKRESGIFSFPSEGTAPLARLHASDGVVNAEDPGANNPNPTTTDKEFNSPIPRPARLGQIAGSLKRRSASMSVLLPMLPPVETMPPPPLPPRRVPAPTDGAMTDSEGYMSSASQAAGRKWGRPQGGIKGKIAAWASETPRKKHHRTVGGASTTDAEPRRSDSPQLGQGYPYSHSPASAPTLQVHTHIHLPTHAQTPLMSIAALAPAARDLALGMGKRVEKFYRGRSASGAGYEPHPSMAGMRVASPGMGMGVGAEPMLSIPLRPATLGASGMLFGRPLDDPVVPRDMEGWVDETLGVRRCVGLPAFVSRSVKHLERWGGDEEGLFRISGRPSHVNRLRAEFDAGADYELSELPPSDLDPHAVSSLFKAYLRELPEPILTRALKPQFDMAMTMESNSNASFDVSKLPTSMTSFGESSENMRSLDDTLLADIKALIDQLPQTNYVLLHELCHLLRYTTEHVQTTKMPIGNLLLLFCPTLSFSAGFLKCLVEGQDTLFQWDRQPPATLPAASPVILPEEPTSPPPLPARTIKTSTSTISPPAKHAASASVAPLSVRSLKSPLNISTEAAGSPRMRSQTTGSAPPSRASMFFPNLGPKRPSINLLFGGNSQESRHSSGSSSYGVSDEEDVRVNPKRQTRPPRVSLDIPDGSFAPSLSPTKDANEETGETDPSPSKRSAQTPIADLFKSSLTAAVPTTAPSAVTVTGTPAPAERWEPSKTLPPRIGLQLRSSEDADEMGWSRGVLDAASASLAGANAKR